MNADVLMLDEPTGHLDVDNIKWLEDWLESFSGSIICTSHFSPFLDKMCTHIIDFQERPWKTWEKRGHGDRWYHPGKGGWLENPPLIDDLPIEALDFQGISQVDEDRKLKTFKGVKGTCLTQFVEKYPEKKAWIFQRDPEITIPGPLLIDDFIWFYGWGVRKIMEHQTHNLYSPAVFFFNFDTWGWSWSFMIHIDP